MNDFLRVQIIYGKCYLKDKPLDPNLWHKLPMLVFDEDVKVPFITILKEDAENLFVLKAIFESANIGVVKVFHHLTFLELWLEIAWIVLIQFYLLHDEHFSRSFFSDFVGYSKGALAQTVQDFKVFDLPFHLSSFPCWDFCHISIFYNN